MPVDPLEEARERLERACTPPVPRFVALGGAVTVRRADLAAILAELDRRSPPTREGAWVTVPREPSEEQLAPYRGLNRTRDTRTIAARIYRDMLAAAPPPPDVSRGLDREEVARIVEGAIADSMGGDWDVAVKEAADAIIALSAPAGGGLDGFGPGARAGWGMAAATEDPATCPNDQSTTPGEKP